jgi:hypothetical protein
MICYRLLFTSISLLIGASAQLVATPPSVERLAPAAGQQGTSFDLTVTGAGLQNASEALLYSPEIQCEKMEARSDNELILHLKTTADCPSGAHTVRIRSAEGISELRVFRISPLPIVAESESNDTTEDAQPIPVNSTIVGTVEAGDIDSYRVTLKKGDRLSAEAEAIRSAGAMLDAVLNVMGSNGQWLTIVDDTPHRRQDPVICLIAPEDGDYIVQIHETNFEGDENSQYALHIGSFPSPRSVFPAGGPAGQTVDVEFRGDSTGLIRQSLDLPQKPNQTIAVHATDAGLNSPAGLPFRVSSFGNVIETEPNQPEVISLPTAVAAELPVALNGVLQQRGDQDCFRVQARANDRIRVEVFAGRLGSPLDSLLEIRDLNGHIIGASDDGVSHDSDVVVVFPETAEYIVQLSDKRGNGGADYFYRIELSPFQPQLTAFLSRPDRMSQDRQAIAVPQGNRVVTFLACQRSGMKGDVQLTASGLPEGLQLPSTQIPADRFWVPIVIEATPDAPIGGGLVGVEVSGQHDGNSVIGHFRQVVDLVAGSADQLFQSAETDRLAVAVVEPVPYAVTLIQPTTSLAPDGTLDLRLEVTRREGFTGPLEISFPFLPPWVDGPDKLIVSAEESTAIYTVRAWPSAVPRTWQLCAEAKATPDSTQNSDESMSESGRGRRSRKLAARTLVASNLVSLTIASSPVAGQIGTVMAEQGTPSEVGCSLQINGSLPESMTAVLEGLPNRVSADSVPVKPGDSIIQFQLQPEVTAPLGTFADLMVRLDGVIDGQNVSWRIGRGGALKIEQSGQLMTDENGKPLSRLDVLRRSSGKTSAVPTTVNPQ